MQKNEETKGVILIVVKRTRTDGRWYKTLHRKQNIQQHEPY
jgi:hypothetical protein